MLPSPRLLLPAFAAMLVTAGVGVPVSVAEPGPGGFVSANVSWVATIPLDSPGIGGRVLQVGAQRRFYVTGAKGLTIFDVTAPGTPLVIGELPLPHFENESVAVSDDGGTVLLASDPGFGQPPVTYVIDTSLVTAPRVASMIPQGTHTASCANVACSHVYASDGWIYDIRDRANPKPAGNWGTGYAHYLSRDASGLLSTGTTMVDPRRDPEHPATIKVKTGGWHNSLRPNAERWRPRKKGDRSAALKPGELHIGGDETWGSPPGCDGNSAAVTTWSVVDFDKGKKAQRIATIRPRNGEYSDGNPTYNVLGCSSHWFDYRKGYVVAGWYDHGTRFIKVDERTGAMTEAGFFMPVATEAWAAHWVDDEYVYTVDALRGIDILRFRRTAPIPTPAETERSWAPPLFRLSPVTLREQMTCRTAAAGSQQRR